MDASRGWVSIPRASRLVGTAATALAVAALAASSASAVPRFAAVGGDDTTSDCTNTLGNPPCTLQRAVEVVAQNGDEVIVEQGTYAEGADQVHVNDDIELHGAAGQPPPVITTSAAGSGVFVQAAGATVRRLQIVYTGNFVGIHLANNTIGEQLVIDATDSACDLRSATLRDSVCWTHGATNESAVNASDLAGGTIDATVRNVTAFGTGTGVAGLNATALNSANVTIDAQNVIAQGTLADVRAFTDASTTPAASVILASSNYDSPLTVGAGSVTPPGTGTNQTAAPLLADAPSGDFHQLPGSPTIDAGASSATSLGTLDPDGDPREADGDGACPIAPDIGADERLSESPPPECPPPMPEPEAGDTTAPDTTITGGPKAKTKKKTATITFSGTDARAVASFQCKLDSGSFESCASPKTYSRLKKGRHTVEVRSVDAAGNVDPTPATRSWKVKKKRRKK